MKRFISALAFCFSLLVLLSLFLFPPVEAKENPLQALLNLPAPPPPNPLVRNPAKNRDAKFYSKSNPPGDNAPIEDLLDYWQQQNEVYQDLRYAPEPSEKVVDRLMKEIGRKPSLLTSYISVLERDPRAAEFVKDIYDRESTSDVFDKDGRKLIKQWLTYHSPYFSNDLARAAASVSDTGEYVTNQEQLLALTRVDFDKARPLIDRLYADSSLKTSRVLARWALYRHALETNSTGDIEQYRGELKAIVEDKSLMPGMRDLAMDALASEKEWSGRDDWYYSLLGDETLADLRVDGQSYTGLTTLMLVSPDEKYLAKMVELAASDNKTIRSAAVRNLVTRLESAGPEVIEALLPWLEDPKWAVDTENSRSMLARKLSEYELPASVPGLIKMLDEKVKRTVPNANSMSANVNAPAAVASNVSRPVNRPASNVYSQSANGVEIETHEFRSVAVLALTKQHDARAIPALRRILPEGEYYERGNVIKALLVCGGFSIPEQLDALDFVAKAVREQIDAADNPPPVPDTANRGYVKEFSDARNARPGAQVTPAEIRTILGMQIMESSEISDELARAVVYRIETLDKSDAPLAAAYRQMVLKWQNAAINLLLLRDVKRGVATVDTMVRLLSQRKDLREKQSSDVIDLRTGQPIVVGIAACLLDDRADYADILENANVETKTAMLACSRLIRAELPIAKVAENLKSPNEMLQSAAERYLESDDSPAARAIVLARHPNEAMILGATTAFYVPGALDNSNRYLWALFESIDDNQPNNRSNRWAGSNDDKALNQAEKGFQNELKTDADLMGIYAYDRNYIRIYKDRVVFSWDDDDSRYRERPLSKNEFDEIKSYLSVNRADEMAPFLGCAAEYCMASELVMVGRSGGRRIYRNDLSRKGGDANNQFFAGLEKYFADLKQTPATLKYNLSREIPGLEIVLASDEMQASTVWKDGADLRVAGSDTAASKKIEAEIADLDDETESDAEEADEEDDDKKNEVLDKKRFEAFAWHKIVDGNIAGPAEQPAMINFLPEHDALSVQPEPERWKAKTADVEIRTSDEGLFKVVRGKLVKLHTGQYSNPVISPNGRWLVAYRSDEEAVKTVVRVDLVTNKEYPVEIEGYGTWWPSAYVSSVGKVLIVQHYGYERFYKAAANDDLPDDAAPAEMLLLDPATGATQPVAGEFRPLGQQTFRGLQKTARPNEYWAAISDKQQNKTVVGVYETKTFGFKPVLTIPKIKFNSMKMWADEPGGKIYFVYRGHVLSLPMP